MECPSCSSRDIEFHESSGHAVCVQCGTVLEENTIVSSIEFQETGDRSHIIGQFVSATSGKSFGSARGHSRYGFTRDSRDMTLANAKRLISQIASTLRLPGYFVDRAHRLYSLALQKNFVFGRRLHNVLATALYTICRQEKSAHLLIDFSDALQTNIFVLGHCFLALQRLLCLKLPVVDPSLYIHRFAARLELGDKVGQVSTTALRLVSRMKKDWMVLGRRPDGVCAAAMLIACRSHGFDKHMADMAEVFRVAISTLRKRLMEFQQTPAAQLTVEQFHVYDAAMELDPPVYINQQLAHAKETGKGVTINLAEPQSGDVSPDLDLKLLSEEDSDEDLAVESSMHIGPVPISINFHHAKKRRRGKARDAARRALYENIYHDVGCATATVVESDRRNDMYQALVSEADEIAGREQVGGWGFKTCSTTESLTVAVPQLNESAPAVTISSAATVASATQQQGDLVDVDEEVSESEVDAFLLSPEEQSKKAAIWEKMHRQFLTDRDARKAARAREAEASARVSHGRQGRKKGAATSHHHKQKSTTGASGDASSAYTRRPSKNINYEALQGVLGAAVDLGIPGFAPETVSGVGPDTTGKKRGAVMTGASLTKPPVRPALSSIAEESAADNTVVPSTLLVGNIVDSLLGESAPAAVAEDEDEEEEEPLVYEDYDYNDDMLGDEDYGDDYY